MTAKRVAEKTACDACTRPTRKGKLTKHRGEWKCPECLNGNQEPIYVPTLQSNMCMWDSEPTLDNGESDKEKGLVL